MKRRLFLLVLFLSLTGANNQVAQSRPPGTGRADEIEIRVNENESAVVIDLDEKENLAGFIHMAFAWGTRFSPPEDLLRGFINLKEAVHTYTDIQVTIDDHVYISSPELLSMPFLFITTDMQFELTDQERENLKKYFDLGGFVVLDNPGANLDRSRAESSLKKMITDTLGSQARIAPLSNTHELYSCYFDFIDGPPNGSEIELVSTRSWFSSSQPTPPTQPEQILYLEGIWYKERLAGIYSGKGYIVKWQENENNEPQLKMGINMLVYSLLQENSIALQKYISSNY